MFDARRVQTLYTRRRRLKLALADMDRRVDRIRKSIVEVEDELRSMVLFVAPLRPRQAAIVQSRDLLDRLHAGDAPTTREVTLWVMERKGVAMPEPRVYRRIQNRVWFALNQLRKRGVVEAEPESRRIVRWKMTH